MGKKKKSGRNGRKGKGERKGATTLQTTMHKIIWPGQPPGFSPERGRAQPRGRRVKTKASCFLASAKLRRTIYRRQAICRILLSFTEYPNTLDRVFLKEASKLNWPLIFVLKYLTIVRPDLTFSSKDVDSALVPLRAARTAHKRRKDAAKTLLAFAQVGLGGGGGW
jgi:hypothetical protein